jgi:hypothetical protein
MAARGNSWLLGEGEGAGAIEKVDNIVCSSETSFSFFGAGIDDDVDGRFPRNPINRDRLELSDPPSPDESPEGRPSDLLLCIDSDASDINDADEGRDESDRLGFRPRGTEEEDAWTDWIQAGTTFDDGPAVGSARSLIGEGEVTVT